MSSPRSSRALALTGPAFAIIFIVVGFVLENGTPGEKASGQEVVDHYNSHMGRLGADAFLGPLAALLLVLFFSHLRTLARERTITPGPGPTVMISGAAIWSAGMLLGSMLNLAILTAADKGQVQVAETVNVLNNMSWLPFIGGLAVTLVGAGMTVLSADILPRWLGWTAVVVGVISVAGPGGFLGFFVAPLWILVAGFLLAWAQARSPAPLMASRSSAGMPS
jgi:hypothetical protein